MTQSTYQSITAKIRNLKSNAKNSSFVANGFDRLRLAVELEVRAEIQQRYAQQPTEKLSWYQRRKQRAAIEKEVRAGVAQKLSSVSPESLF